MSTPFVRARVPYTYDEYRLLPEDGQRNEIIDGEIYVSPALSPFHQIVSGRLQHALMRILGDTGLAYIFTAPIDVILDSKSVVQPDLAIVSAARKSIISARGIEGPPDVVAEILSPSSRITDEKIKLAAYARFAIPEYWIIDPEMAYVDIYPLTAAGYGAAFRHDRAATLTSPVFPQITVRLEPIFMAL